MLIGLATTLIQSAHSRHPRFSRALEISIRSLRFLQAFTDSFTDVSAARHGRYTQVQLNKSPLVFKVNSGVDVCCSKHTRRMPRRPRQAVQKGTFGDPGVNICNLGLEGKASRQAPLCWCGTEATPPRLSRHSSSRGRQFVDVVTAAQSAALP